MLPPGWGRFNRYPAMNVRQYGGSPPRHRSSLHGDVLVRRFVYRLKVATQGQRHGYNVEGQFRGLGVFHVI
jgi:hypothetical protein